jgi:hypothetical protein
MRLTPRHVGFVALAVLAVGGLSLSAQQPRPRTPADIRMSGTFDLESTRGGNPQRAAEAATRSLPLGQRDRAYQALLARLDPPQRISIDREGRLISIASDRGPRAAFDADGRTYNDRDRDGRMVSTRADVYGDRLGIDVGGGSRGSNFSVTFESLNNGANLRVTRRLDDPDLARPVSFQSYYRRFSREARWDVYDDGPGFGRGRGNARGRGDDGRGNASRGGGWVGWNPADVTVPDGMRLVATLDTPLSMRTSRNGEPFSMTVRGPGEFQDARIHGVVSRVRASNSRGDDMDMHVDFQRIDVRGRSMDFDAVLNTIRLADGTVLRVNADGEVRENSTGETVRNGAIGGAIGAVIGAVIGGGKAAAIGAVIGGAGGVILSQGHERLDLPRGAEVTLTTQSRYRAP